MIHKQGFTLLEILLSVAIIGILAGLSLPIFRGAIIKNDLDIAATTIAQSARRAQLLSQSVDGDSAWGIYVQDGSITIFKGLSYATRDTNSDEITVVPSQIFMTGGPELVFSKLTGGTTGTTYTLTSPSDTKTIVINSKGMVSF